MDTLNELASALENDPNFATTVTNQIATKASTTALTTSSNLKTDTTTTDNSAVAWSSGLAGGGYHYRNTGTDSLVIRTGSGETSANFLGSVGGAATDGKVIF